MKDKSIELAASELGSSLASEAVPVDRRAFMKKSGGATAATLLAVHGFQVETHAEYGSANFVDIEITSISEIWNTAQDRWEISFTVKITETGGGSTTDDLEISLAIGATAVPPGVATAGEFEVRPNTGWNSVPTYDRWEKSYTVTNSRTIVLECWVPDHAPFLNGSAEVSAVFCGNAVTSDAVTLNK